MHGVLHQVAESVRKAKATANETANETVDKFREQIDDAVKHYDLSIQFIGADGIPKMDVVGSADPYFIAKLDNKITYT